MLPAHEDILSIQLVKNNKYARQVRSCAAGFRSHDTNNFMAFKCRTEYFKNSFFLRVVTMWNSDTNKNATLRHDTVKVENKLYTKTNFIHNKAREAVTEH
jgi:hypothetical protein